MLVKCTAFALHTVSPHKDLRFAGDLCVLPTNGVCDLCVSISKEDFCNAEIATQ